MSALTDPRGFKLSTLVETQRGMTEVEVHRYLTESAVPDIAEPPVDEPDGLVPPAGDEQIMPISIVQRWLGGEFSDTLLSSAAIKMFSMTTIVAGFDPNQPRDSEGKWSKIPGINVPSPDKQRFRKLIANDADVMHAEMQSKKSWTNAQIKALRDYASDGHKKANPALRGMGVADAKTKKLIADARAGMRPASRDIVVFRGTWPAQFGIKSSMLSEAWKDEFKSHIGEVFHDPAFASTSTSSFSAFKTGLQLEIEVPKGTPLAYIAGISANPSEREVVLAPDLHYQLLGFEQTMVGPIARMRVIPPPPKTVEQHEIALDVPTGDPIPADVLPDAVAAPDPTPPVPTSAPKTLRENDALLAPPRQVRWDPDTDRWTGGVTDLEIAALDSYVGTGHKSINTNLRNAGGTGKITKAVKQHVDALDGLLAGSELQDDILVFRGIRNGRDIFGDDWDQDLTGVTWDEHGFLSTTASSKIATKFAADQSIFGKPETAAVMHITVPKGTQALTMSDLDDEAEILIARGQKLRIVKDHGLVDGRRRLDVEVVPSGEGAATEDDAGDGERAQVNANSSADPGTSGDGLPGDGDEAAQVPVVSGPLGQKIGDNSAKKVTPAVIYKKHADGAVVAEAGDRRMRWDASRKKFVVERRNGEDWQETAQLTKTAAYEDTKVPGRWFEPGSGAAAISTAETGLLDALPMDLGEEPTAKISGVVDPRQNLTPGQNARYAVTGHNIKPQLSAIKINPGLTDQIQQVNDLFARRYGVSFDTVEHSSTYAKEEPETKIHKNAIAYVRNRFGVMTLGLNPKISQGMFKKAEKIGLWPPGTGHVQSLMTHEFAHALLQGDGLVSLWQRDSSTLGKALKTAKEAARAANMPPPGKGIGVGEVSTYAKENNREAEAELFAFYHWGGSKRPPWVVVWGETLHRELGLDPTPITEDLGVKL